MSGLKSLQSTYPVIGDVRGHGLFIGVEFVSPEPGRTSRSVAEYIVSRMLDHRILTSLDGPGGDVMKIKPPLCISLQEVRRFLETLEKILAEDVIKF
jgi:4-aminobutyrate aminotransferase-like enzyme